MSFSGLSWSCHFRGNMSFSGLTRESINMELLSGSEIRQVFSRWQAQNPEPASELEYKNPFTLLVAVVLSAQATDKSVNLATKDLFKVVDTPQKMLALGEEGLIPYIKSIGLYKSKAAHVIGLSRKLIEDFDGQVPDSREKLMTLPGVGRKTANVVLNVIFHQPVMPVDTHLLRVSPKIGLAEGKTPEEVEASLVERIPPEYMHNAHHWILLHGRYVCTARNPKCDNCIISDLCKRNGEKIVGSSPTMTKCGSTMTECDSTMTECGPTMTK